jgi:Plasmid pRiA4b ORF-3-like protein
VAEIACLRVEIDDVAPAVRRRVEVLLTMRLDDVHFVLQIAIGWQNCHPFEFRIGDKAWGLVDRDAAENPLPAETATLADLLALGPTFAYSYVFGDDWHHTVTIERVAGGGARRGVHPPLIGRPRPAMNRICAHSPIRGTFITRRWSNGTIPISTPTA